MTIAKTGTDVTRTAIGNSILTRIINTLFSSSALSVAKISDDCSTLKLAAPVIPIMRYKATQTRIGNAIVLWIETDLDNSLMKDGTVVILAVKVSGSPLSKESLNLRMQNCSKQNQ
jgi:hypothetical protein